MRVRQITANGPVNRLKQLVQTHPNLHYQWLVRVQNIERNQPTHDDVDDHDCEDDTQDQIEKLIDDDHCGFL